MFEFKNCFCYFSRIDGRLGRKFQLLETGEIKDIGSNGNNNERFWSIEGENFILKSKENIETSRFQISKKEDFFLELSGVHKQKIQLKIIVVKKLGDLFFQKTKWKHLDDIKAGVLKVGDNTYGGVHMIDKQYGKVIIGDYCSIANGVKIVVGNHRTDLVTTYPFRTLNQFWPETKVIEDDHFSKGETVIGSDVWIGNNAQIMSGIHIGSGAIIAANAVVTKNVEPYSIVGGNPAKHLKYRIDNPETRKKMLEIAWWDWSEEIISERLNKIMSPDIDSFVKEFHELDS